MGNKELVKRALKYIIQWLVVFMAAKFIPSKKLDFKDITIIAIIGAISFAILDMYSPTLSDMGRGQTGMTIGLKTLIL